MTIIDGKGIAAKIYEEIREKLAHQPVRSPCLAVICVGDNPASLLYTKRKREACAQVGITSRYLTLPQTTTEQQLLIEVLQLNEDPDVDGILVQLPLPPHINPSVIIHAIDPEKDVDGFHPYNLGKLLIGEPGGFISCTPLGVAVMLHRSGITVAGKHVVIIGRSNIVGKPLAALLMQNSPLGNATVTVAHSKTHHLAQISSQADILIAAIGQPQFVNSHFVKEGAVVVDVGINQIAAPEHPKGVRLVGDVDFNQVAPKCAAITPVPGGVGPMTIAMLLQNTLLSYERRIAE